MTVELPEIAALDEHLQGLAGIRESDAPGWTRRALTESATAGREETARRMRAAGLDCHVDGAGNLIGILPGRNSGPALVTGSHTDTVHGGGRFDGTVGVFAAIEAVQALARADRRLNHDLWVVDFYGEEPNDFGLSCLGSRALAGNLHAEHLDRVDPTGRSLGAAMAAVGIDPNAALQCRWQPDEVAAFVELHIEQGPVLQTAGQPIGVVSSIAGIDRAELVFHGRRDHAGTMPVELRHDAACAAAEALLAVERLGRDGGVGLAGQLVLSPGAANVVPDRAHLTVEFRSITESWLIERKAVFTEAAREAADRRGVRMEIDWISGEPSVPMTASMTDEITAAARQLGYDPTVLPSGAGHDTVQMAALSKVGMIFIPSHDGRSHCPEEFTESADVAIGAAVLAQTLLQLDVR